ncbi:MAG: metallophosphoesterase [Bacilli bacterium]|nr:metallophosphoesterase [Bacilli bacterium]
MIYFISDTHFNHSNIIEYCNRPFNDIKEMNDTLIDNWNSIVKKDDIVYHLGDFALADEEELKVLYSKLNGTIILIRGNHDGKSAKYYEEIGFKVLTNAPIKLDEYKLILSHTPVPDTKIPDGYINIHGHIHNKKLIDGYPTKIYSADKHINVSVDAINFKPLGLEEINALKIEHQ